MVGRYRAYPEYKPSGVEWLGDVPKHWDVSTRIKFISSLKGRLGWQGLKADEYIEEGPYVVSSAHFSEHKIQWDTCPHVSPERYELDRNIQLAEGDLLLMKDGAAMGKLAYVDNLPDKACLNSHLLLFRPRNSKNEPSYDTKFMYYFMQTDFFQGYIKVNGTGATFLGISQQAIGNFRLVFPSLIEQSQISAFLDHETGQIDALIAKQQRLIALLEEKRQAVISHAVTKGLNPSAPLRPSGIDWLGDVPEHWEVMNYRYATQIYRGKFGHRPRNDPSLYKGGTFPFIQTGDVAQADKYIENFKQTLNAKGASISQLFPAGTLVMAIAANIGDTAILNFEAYAPDSVVGFRPTAKVGLEFLRYSLLAALPALEKTSTQSTQANLNIDRIGSVQAAFPPLAEQEEISKHLDRMAEKHAALDSKAQSAITLLKERRTALISAAVTGKIDLRDWQAPAAATASTTDISKDEFA